MTFPEAALLHEVSRVQHDKTIQAVRDLIAAIPTDKKKPYGRDWERESRSAKEFRDDLVKRMEGLR